MKIHYEHDRTLLKNVGFLSTRSSTVSFQLCIVHFIPQLHLSSKSNRFRFMKNGKTEVNWMIFFFNAKHLKRWIISYLKSTRDFLLPEVFPRIFNYFNILIFDGVWCHTYLTFENSRLYVEPVTKHCGTCPEQDGSTIISQI